MSELLNAHKRMLLDRYGIRYGKDLVKGSSYEKGFFEALQFVDNAIDQAKLEIFSDEELNYLINTLSDENLTDSKDVLIGKLKELKGGQDGSNN